MVEQEELARYERPHVRHFRRNQAHCPQCEQYGWEGHVAFKNGRAHCTRHGCTLVAGEWVYLCEGCGAEVNALHGWPTPYLCKECLDKAPICGICRQPRPMCCC